MEDSPSITRVRAPLAWMASLLMAGAGVRAESLHLPASPPQEAGAETRTASGPAPDALAPRPHTDKFRIADFRADAGVAGAPAFDMDIAPDGTLWIASAHGVHSYDGYEWARYDMDDGLPSSYVHCVEVTREGVVWIGTDKGAGFLVDGRYVPVAPDRKLQNRSVRSIYEDRRDDLWFCCDRGPMRHAPGGLLRLSGENWSEYTKDDGLPTDYISDVFESSTGEIFVLTHLGLALMQGETFVDPLATLPRHNSRDYISSMVELHDGRLVAATKHALYWRKAGVWESHAYPDAHLAMPTLLVTADGNLLSVSHRARGRIVALTEEASTTAGPTFINDGSTTLAMVEAADGAIWMSGFNLLSRWERGAAEWESFNKELGALQAQDSSGNLWLHDVQTTVVGEQGSMHIVEDSQGVFGMDGEGSVWVMASAGFARYTGLKSEEIPIPAPDFSLSSLRMVPGSSTYLLGLSADEDELRVAHWFEHSWHYPDVPQDRRADRWIDARASADGNLWVSTQAGTQNHLLQLRDGQWAVSTLPAEAQHLHPVHLSLMADGELWICGLFGLFRKGSTTELPWEAFDIRGRNVIGLWEIGGERWAHCNSLTGGLTGLARLKSMGAEFEFFETQPLRLVGADKKQLTFANDRELWFVEASSPTTARRIRLPRVLSIKRAFRGEDSDLWLGTPLTVMRHRPNGLAPRLLLNEPTHEVEEGALCEISVRALAKNTPTSAVGEMRVTSSIDRGPWTTARLEAGGRLVFKGLESGAHTIDLRVQDAGRNTSNTVTAHIQVRPTPLPHRWWFGPFTISLMASLVILGALLHLGRKRLSQRTAHLMREVERHKQDLARSERRFRRLFEQSEDAIYIADLAGLLVEANPAMTLLANRAGIQLETGTLLHIFANPEELAELEIAVREQGLVQHSVHRLICAEHSPIDVRITANLLRSDNGEPMGYMAILRDISKQRHLEERTLQSQKMEAVGHLAGGIAHDFNNMLTIIVGSAELLRKHVDGDREREDVDAILGAASRAQDLTGQLQTFSRGRIVRPSIIDLNRIVAEMDGLMQRLIGEDIVLHASLDPSPGNVLAATTQIEQVITNLVVNARDAMPTGGRLWMSTRNVILDTEEAARLSLEPNREYVRLAITDTGCGMSVETQARIFEPCFTTKYSGMGLGLATVFGIVQQCEASIHVQSAIDKGSTFSIFFPNRTEPAPCSQEREVGYPQRSGNETILIAEDDEGIRCLLERVLVEWGYTVLLAHDGLEALEIISERGASIDLLLTDVIMPRLRGDALAQHVRDMKMGIKVVFMTGYAEVRGEEGLLGSDSCILDKPIRPRELKAALRRTLDGTTEEMH